ncbi:hypothetical protein LUZ63_008843 [Rhynchospora breviuscula]|uniref:ATP-dependent DNA helicase n=1 Tax=Rhynchospora breviuscula TaxID=2022672 RepID=A0A9Q0HNL3_9POAL|nr:hypothetical protein LUZ63_008843 [Rhynchospora breviuscula]
MELEGELHNHNHNHNLLQDQTQPLLERSLLDELKESQTSTPQNDNENAAEDWSRCFHWDSRADDIRFNTFGLSSYRANQREIINAVMSGRDVLVIMAAGGGKSLCYQLPAVLRDGITLVVSPLLSLIQDQVMGLKALGIPAHVLTSTTCKEDEKVIYKALDRGIGALKILYVTPEKISKSKRFMSKLEKCYHGGRLSLVAIDEAHCCSQWAHDFRPDFKDLGILKIQFPNIPVAVLTATATYKVQMDLIEILHIPKCVKFVSTVNRPNLFYKIHDKSSIGKCVVDEIADFIKGSYPNNESGIVYCLSKKECEKVAKDLHDRGISADFYHEGMDVVSREKVHLRWKKSKLQVIVGTVTFGMGIDKPDVRFVIHHSLSESLETYYQGSGRAGSDGLPSECVLYYRPGDVPRQSSMVFYENCGLQNLYDMVRYCQSKRICRRSAFLHHFGETAQDCNGMCDNCAYGFEIKEVDCSYVTTVIISLLQQIQEIDQKTTMLQLVDRFMSKIKELGGSEESASDLKREEIEQLVIQLIVDCILKEEFQHTAYSTNAYVTLGPLWKQVLDGKRRVNLEIHTNHQVGSNNSTDKGAKRKRTSRLEKKLDDLRSEISSQHGGIFPHSVLSLQHMSLLNTHKPTSLDKLEKLIGKVRTEKYGAQIMHAIEECFNFESSDSDQEFDLNKTPKKKGTHPSQMHQDSGVSTSEFKVPATIPDDRIFDWIDSNIVAK